jgi:hypothetical protein
MTTKEYTRLVDFIQEYQLNVSSWQYSLTPYEGKRRVGNLGEISNTSNASDFGKFISWPCGFVDGFNYKDIRKLSVSVTVYNKKKEKETFKFGRNKI